MKKILVALPDEMFKELDRHPNKSQAIRNALNIYNEHISTDTVDGLRRSYVTLQKYMERKFDYYDKVFKDLEKLINYLETRM
jgi:metal-responsive CopG/Arc/MetJ family transcriptional regulator